MRVYQIFVPELNTYVKFKVFPAEDISSFLNDVGNVDEDEFCRAVLEHLVFNMKTEIRESLKMMSIESARATIEALYNGCIMLNPGLDLDLWVSMAYSKSFEKPTEENSNDLHEAATGLLAGTKVPLPAPKKKKLSNAKFVNLKNVLSDRVIGQEEAITTVCNALKRSQAGLNDEKRPLGVFLFAGASGVGKSSLAKELHSYLYGDDTPIVRIDCGEYQHKHDNQKLIGSPPGYIGHDDGGQLTNGIIKNPNTVVLLDEIEKAHPDIWSTFLRVFDEGIATDSKGNTADFRNAIIIMTTNLGNDKVVESMMGKSTGFNARIERTLLTKDLPPRAVVERTTNESIQKLFKPEFLNRIDYTVIFNHLAPQDYVQIAEMELHLLDAKLHKKGITFSWDERVTEALIDQGVDTVMGARGMAQIRREQIETVLAEAILEQKATRGTVFELSFDEKFTLQVRKPRQSRAKAA